MERTRDEVYNRARELQIRGRGKMTKAELLEAASKHSGECPRNRPRGRTPLGPYL